MTGYRLPVGSGVAPDSQSISVGVVVADPPDSCCLNAAIDDGQHAVICFTCHIVAAIVPRLFSLSFSLIRTGRACRILRNNVQAALCRECRREAWVIRAIDRCLIPGQGLRVIRSLLRVRTDIGQCGAG